MRKVTIPTDPALALDAAGHTHGDWPSSCLALAGQFTDFPLAQSENDGPSATASRGNDDIFAAKSALESEFADSIEAENKRVESKGILGAELRPW